MLRHLGYMGGTRSIDACTSRSCRIEEATSARVRTLIGDNLRDVRRIFHFNADRGIAFYRISSRLIPQASHPCKQVAWWDEFAEVFDTLGEFISRRRLRMEMHPGQHSLLNSPSPETVALSILELGWHVHLFDAMRLDVSHKLVVRIGGTFGDKHDALNRFIATINRLPETWRCRLAIEDEGVGFGLAEVLEASEKTGLPVVLACSPHGPASGSRLPDRASIDRCFSTWKAADGPAIIHLGGPAPLRKSSKVHEDWVDPEDLEILEAHVPEALPFDCLLEAAQGDLALFRLRERMATRERGALAGRPGGHPASIS